LTSGNKALKSGAPTLTEGKCRGVANGAYNREFESEKMCTVMIEELLGGNFSEASDALICGFDCAWSKGLQILEKGAREQTVGNYSGMSKRALQRSYVWEVYNVKA
jgi:hypothetical protein